jgi:tripartite-type tricarboxylate transporter receptor subunit TctC
MLSPQGVTMELLLQRSGVVVTHIPYRGAAPAMTDLLAGVVQLKLDTYTTSNPQVQAGKLRMLAIASSHRSRLCAPRMQMWRFSFQFEWT